MVRKQSATKSATKHSGAESLEHDAPISIPFTINPKQPHFWNMKFLPERGYDMRRAHSSFKATIEALHWEKFVEHRTHYMEQLVREFYAGLITKSGEILSEYSMVRGMKVMFDEETINKHYQLSYTGNSFDEKLKNYGKKRMEQIKNRVAIPNAPWEKISHTEFKLKIRYIISELSNWHMFINCSIMPTSHNYTLPKDRLIILDCIMTDEEINIGRIINNEIRDCAKKTDGFLYFPCLITELCEKQGVKISEAEKNQKKKPPSALSAEMKTRRIFKNPEELGKEKKVFEKKMKEKVTEKDDKKDAALKRFLLDQHEWIKKRLEEISDTPTNLEIPEFPLWIFEDLEAEKETEKEVSEEEEVVEKKKSMKRKKATTRKGKEKKRTKEEEWIEIEDTEEESTEEEEIMEVLKQMEKDTEEEVTNTTTEGSEKGEDDDDLDFTMEEILRKKKGQSPVIQQIDPSHQSSPKTPTPVITTPPSTPPSTGTTPPPPSKEADVTQAEKQKEKESTKEPTPPLDQTREQTPPLHDRSTILLPYIVSDTGSMQVAEDISISAEGAKTAETPVEAETGASAPGEPAPARKPATAATVVVGNIEETLKVVMAELAEKKRAELGNTQKFFKKPTSTATGEGSVGAGAPVKKTVKEVTAEEDPTLKEAADVLKDLTEKVMEDTAEVSKATQALTSAAAPEAAPASAPVKETDQQPTMEMTTEEPEQQVAIEAETTLKDVAETHTDTLAKALEQPKKAEVQGGAQSPGDPAPEELTPPATKTAALKPGASGGKSTGKKEKKQKPKPTPTRSSSRLRSGAKPQ